MQRAARHLDLPRDVKLALLRVRAWCEENGYEIKIFRKASRK